MAAGAAAAAASRLCRVSAARGSAPGGQLPPPLPWRPQVSVPCRRRCRWLAPRAAAVEELFFAAVAEEPANPNHYTLLAVPKLLFSCCPADAPLPLAKLSIEWPEAVLLGGPRGALPLPLLAHLRKLALPAVGRLDIGERIPASLALSDFGLCGGTLWGRDAALAAPWLPPSVTALFLESAGLRALPPVLTHLPRLRRCCPWGRGCGQEAGQQPACRASAAAGRQRCAASGCCPGLEQTLIEENWGTRLPAPLPDPLPAALPARPAWFWATTG